MSDERVCGNCWAYERSFAVKPSHWVRKSAVLGCSVTVFALAACSAGSGSSSDHSVPAAGSTVSITPALVSAANAEGTVTVEYGASLDSMTAMVKKFNQVYPKIKVVLERKAGAPGGAALLQEFEAGKKHVDVFGGTDIPTSLELSKAGAFLNVKPSDEAAYSPEYRIASGLYATSSDPVVVGFNTKQVSTAQAKSLSNWQGVLSPTWKGKLGVTTPAVSTGGTALYYGWKKVGGDWAKNLAAQSPKLYTGTAESQDALVSGQISVAFGQLESGMLNLVNQGAPVGFVYTDPEVEFPSNYYGILSNAPDPAAAELFWTWITSKQACQSEQQSPIFMHCPMSDVGPVSGIPTKAAWYSPPGQKWTPNKGDWLTGMPQLATEFSSVFGTP